MHQPTGGKIRPPTLSEVPCGLAGHGGCAALSSYWSMQLGGVDGRVSPWKHLSHWWSRLSYDLWRTPSSTRLRLMLRDGKLPHEGRRLGGSARPPLEVLRHIPRDVMEQFGDAQRPAAKRERPYAGRTSVKLTRIVVTHYGGPEALRVVEEECPEPKDGEVRVRVLAAGVSLPDIMAREGVHPETPPVPFTPGWDLVGEVDRLGDGISGIKPGQIVAAMPISGAYAEFICLPQRELVPVPSGLDAAEAVSLILNYVTAYQMLHRSAKVRPGQRVLIHGASG